MHQTNIIRLVVLAITGIFCVDDAMAQAADTSQANSYPESQCAKPDLKLIKPPEITHNGNMYDSGPVGSYNSRVKAFNKANEAYASCIHTYVENGNREVQRIQEEANADMKRIKDNANASMAAVHDKIQKALQEGNDFAAQQNALAAELEKKADKGAH
jgi:hypothetical protein